MKALLVSLLVGTLVVLAVVGGRYVVGRKPQPPPARLAPDFELLDFQGRTVKLADFKGRPLVVNSWAAWCPFCKKELVDFATIQAELGEAVVMVAIDRAESLEVAQKFTDEAGVTQKLVFLLDPQDSFYQALGGFSMPETIFVDRQGVIRDHKRGPMEADEIRQRLNSIL